MLIAATLAISAFVMVDSGSSDGESGIPLMGVVLILVDVIVLVLIIPACILRTEIAAHLARLVALCFVVSRC